MSLSPPAEVLVDDTNLSRLEMLYDETLGTTVDRQAELRNAKGLMTDRNFEGEFTTLLKIASELAGHNGAEVEHDDIRHALRELLIAFPVYRTYGTAEGLTPPDVALLSRVVASVNASEPALSLIVRILTGDLPEHDHALASLFRTRFQQLTGPLMAKSVEDTLFFRHNGAGPERSRRRPDAARVFTFPFSSGNAHSSCPPARCAAGNLHPRHQTRRGCTSSSLYADGSARSVGRKSGALAADEPDAGPIPQRWHRAERRRHRMIFRALAGVWPATLSPEDRDGLKSLEERFLGFIEKALREAKQRTDWIDSNEGYESVVRTTCAICFPG